MGSLLKDPNEPNGQQSNNLGSGSSPKQHKTKKPHVKPEPLWIIAEEGSDRGSTMSDRGASKQPKGEQPPKHVGQCVYDIKMSDRLAGYFNDKYDEYKSTGAQGLISEEREEKGKGKGKAE